MDCASVLITPLLTSSCSSAASSFALSVPSCSWICTDSSASRAICSFGVRRSPGSDSIAASSAASFADSAPETSASVAGPGVAGVVADEAAEASAAVPASDPFGSGRSPGSGREWE